MFKRNILISFILLFIFIIFIILLKTVDVRCNSINNSCIGLYTINHYFFNKIGVNIFFYNITDYLGLIPIFISIIYAIIGLKQLLHRKKVDIEIIIEIIKDMTFNTLVILFLNNLLFIIIELPNKHILIKVWLEGKDASNTPSIRIGL